MFLKKKRGNGKKGRNERRDKEIKKERKRK
jgi:hypothetical protein